MVFNHYFTLVDKSFPEKKDLLRQGFVLTGPRSHKGQGTSAEFILFPQNYIEYIWIDDLEASKNNLLKLYPGFAESIHDLSMPLIFIDARSLDPKDAEPQNSKNISAQMLNPPNKFFIPREMSTLKMPDYFKGLIET